MLLGNLSREIKEKSIMLEKKKENPTVDLIL